MPALDDFHQLALRFTDPVQHDYEVIREIMLADATIAERSRATGLDRATVREKAHRFLEEGMRGLIDRRTTTDKGQHSYPDVVAGYILYVKQRYPPIHHREIARIVGRKYGYKTNHITIKRFLEHHPIPVQLPLPLTGYHQFDDAYRARWTVVRMHGVPLSSEQICTVSSNCQRTSANARPGGLYLVGKTGQRRGCCAREGIILWQISAPDKSVPPVKLHLA